jgi:hypothetical protein
VPDNQDPLAAAAFSGSIPGLIASDEQGKGSVLLSESRFKPTIWSSEFFTANRPGESRAIDTFHRAMVDIEVFLHGYADRSDGLSAPLPSPGGLDEQLTSRDPLDRLTGRTHRADSALEELSHENWPWADFPAPGDDSDGLFATLAVDRLNAGSSRPASRRLGDDLLATAHQET